MADEEHLKILIQGVSAWNKWREENPEIRPNLISLSFTGADISGFESREVSQDLEDCFKEFFRKNLRGVNFRGALLQKAHLRNTDLQDADLSGANLSEADLTNADLSGADLRDCVLHDVVLTTATLQRVVLIRASLYGAYLSGVNLIEADLQEASLNNIDLSDSILSKTNCSNTSFVSANLSRANLSEANLSNADLSKAILVETNLEKAILSGCKIFGISAWKPNLKGTIQTNLILSENSEPVISVDNLEVAQFIYLLLDNEKIRHVIDTITSKVVLILGRFTSERKKILEVIRETLRKYDYVPVLFDFEKPRSKSFVETVATIH